MPVTTRVPVSDERSTGGKRRPAMLSDLYIVYGNPHELHNIGSMTANCTYVGDDAELTFLAQDAADQSLVDTWAAEIDADEPNIIRGKIDAEAELDEARVKRDGGERQIFKMGN
jgi:hypothetical protein